MTAATHQTGGVCDYCKAAELMPDFPFSRDGCQGCAVRSLALGGLLPSGSVEGVNARLYRQELSLIFGDRWHEGHELVAGHVKQIKANRAALDRDPMRTTTDDAGKVRSCRARHLRQPANPVPRRSQ